MKKIFTYVVFISICLVGKALPNEQVYVLDEQELLRRFASMVATDEGMTITFKDSGARYHLGIDGTPSGLNEYGEELVVPYDHTVKITSRHGGLIFEPLQDASLNRKGFLLEEYIDTRSMGGERSVTKAILLAKIPPDAEGKTFEVIEYNEEDSTAEVVVTEAGGSSPPQEIQSLPQENPAPKINTTDVAQTWDAPNEPPQTASEKSSNQRKFVFPIVGVLVLTFFAFFKLRKR